MNESEYKRFLKSPALLVAYLVKTDRKVAMANGKFMLECPAKKCHCDNPSHCENDPNGYSFMSAQISIENGTGISRVTCTRCGGSWDIFGIRQYDLKCTREEAVHDVVVNLSVLLNSGEDDKPASSISDGTGAPVARSDKNTRSDRRNKR